MLSIVRTHWHTWMRSTVALYVKEAFRVFRTAGRLFIDTVTSSPTKAGQPSSAVQPWIRSLAGPLFAAGLHGGRTGELCRSAGFRAGYYAPPTSARDLNGSETAIVQSIRHYAACWLCAHPNEGSLNPTQPRRSLRPNRTVPDFSLYVRCSTPSPYSPRPSHSQALPPAQRTRGRLILDVTPRLLRPTRAKVADRKGPSDTFPVAYAPRMRPSGKPARSP